jgi:hypothetical protein
LISLCSTFFFLLRGRVPLVRVSYVVLLLVR